MDQPFPQTAIHHAWEASEPFGPLKTPLPRPPGTPKGAPQKETQITMHGGHENLNERVFLYDFHTKYCIEGPLTKITFSGESPCMGGIRELRGSIFGPPENSFLFIFGPQAVPNFGGSYPC